METGFPQNLDNMSHEDIIALTEEDINHRIMLACAQDGIPLLKEPTPLETWEAPKPDLVCYQVDHVVTTNEEFANKLAMLLETHKGETFRLEYDYKISDKYQTLTAPFHTDFPVKRTPYFSQENYASIKDKLAERTKLEAEYTAKLKEFSLARNAKQGWVDDIRGTWEDHLQLEEIIKLQLLRFKEYLELAKNNKAMAYSFFCKTYRTIDEIIYERIVAEFKIPIGEAEEVKESAEQAMIEKETKSEATSN